MAEKKKRTPLKESNPYKFYRNGYYACVGGQYASIIAPFVAIGIVNFDKYFTVSTGQTVKMSLGCTLAIMVLGIALWQKTKQNKQEINHVVGWGVAFALCYLFQSIIQDLTLIIGCAFAGQCVAYGFELGADNRESYMSIYKEADIKANAFERAKAKKKKEEVTPYE